MGVQVRRVGVCAGVWGEADGVGRGWAAGLASAARLRQIEMRQLKERI